MECSGLRNRTTEAQSAQRTNGRRTTNIPDAIGWALGMLDRDIWKYYELCDSVVNIRSFTQSHADLQMPTGLNGAGFGANDAGPALASACVRAHMGPSGLWPVRPIGAEGKT